MKGRRKIRGKRKPMWRVGRKLGRTIYLHDTLVGMMDHPDLAKIVVDVMNLMTDKAVSS